MSNAARARNIAKNTVMLYVRMIFLMLIGLYTSRVVLSALGISDYGIYNAVGGFVAMFAVISGALSGAISRFLTFELGSGADEARLKAIFSSSQAIQLIIAAVITALALLLGPWFMAHKMSIPPERLEAARIVLYMSILTFDINLISVPWNAAIIAREKMKAFAWIGIFEGIAKLGVALLLARAGSDRLVLYAVLMCAVALTVRLVYGVYCRKNFPECAAGPRWNGPLTRKMFTFAGWNFIGVSSGVLRDHGGNILLNMFFGPAVNAARGLAVIVSGAVGGFVNNFMTALNPQITKSYAAGERDYLMTLLFKGSKFSFYLLLLLGLPVLMNTPFLMDVWQKTVPMHTVLFVQLMLLFVMSESLSNPLVTVSLATGDIKRYQLTIGGIQLLNLPVSYVLLKFFDAPVWTVPAVALVISQLAFFARLILLRGMVGLDARLFLRKVYANVLVVSAVSACLPLLVQHLLPPGWAGCLLSCAICVLWSGAVIFLLGFNAHEKSLVLDKIRRCK